MCDKQLFASICLFVRDNTMNNQQLKKQGQSLATHLCVYTEKKGKNEETKGGKNVTEYN